MKDDLIDALSYISPSDLSYSEWVSVGMALKEEGYDVYADEGISGTKTKNRAGFNKMIEDCFAGKIDLIITKSISRFARNTVDTLVNVRKLKEKGIEVYFEKENVHTLDNSGELMLTILSSLAQEESRSISDNVRWGIRNRFANGKFTLGSMYFLGYDKGPDGTTIINEEQAGVVRQVYKMFINGCSYKEIALELNEIGAKKANGNVGTWNVSNIKSIINNEKYKGDALLQKTYITDFLTKKVKKNKGELPKYYVKDSHPAIVTEDDWALAQLEVKRREKAYKELGSNYSNNVFTSKFICEDCGSYIGSKVWHSNDPKNRKVIWQCIHKYRDKYLVNKKKDDFCKTPHYVAEELEAMFVKAYYKFLNEKGKYLEDLAFIKKVVCDTTKIDKEIEETKAIIQAMQEEADEMIKNPEYLGEKSIKYRKKYAELELNFVNTKEKLNDLLLERADKVYKVSQIEAFIDNLSKLKEETFTFDEGMFRFLIDRGIVHRDKSITFIFKTGLEIKVDWED